MAALHHNSVYVYNPLSRIHGGLLSFLSTAEVSVFSYHQKPTGNLTAPPCAGEEFPQKINMNARNRLSLLSERSLRNWMPMLTTTEWEPVESLSFDPEALDWWVERLEDRFVATLLAMTQ